MICGDSQKRTKIVCTIGPASQEVPVLRRMLRAGMNVARLNFSHGTHSNHMLLARNVRRAARETGRPVAVLADLQGPKIRIGDLPAEGVRLQKGRKVIFSTARGASYARSGKIPVQFPRLHKDVGSGDRLLLDDGKLEVRVEGVRGRDILCRVTLGGKLIAHKGITVPTASLSASALTPKDKKDLKFVLRYIKADFVALSFVRHASDVHGLRRLMRQFSPRGRLPEVVVKIEKHEALKNFDAILAETDAVMVARGDLALETPAAQVPLRQKEMIQACLQAAKPVITATQMLDSMTDNPRPTRAELTDVANAVIDHTDATMLSNESAVGKYPVETVETMARIIARTEESPFDDLVHEHADRQLSSLAAAAAAACEAARVSAARALLVLSASGHTVRLVARHRPLQPIYAFVPSQVVARKLLLVWGVTPLVVGIPTPEGRTPARTALRFLVTQRCLRRGEKVVLVDGTQVERGKGDISFKILTV
jgi:pyruvate kinase